MTPHQMTPEPKEITPVSTVISITDRAYTAPDAALAMEIAGHAVDVAPMIRDRGEDGPGDTAVTPAELTAEYATLVAYADAAADAGARVSVTCPEIIREDGFTYMPDLAAVPAADWPRALLTAALTAAALRKGLREAEEQFAGLLWAARGVAEMREPDTAPCSDCGRVIRYIDEPWYAVDSGGVCFPCGQARGLTEDYLQ